MQRQPRSALQISSTNIRIRSLRSLVFFFSFPSSMEASSFSSSIGGPNASSASADPRKETFSEAVGDGESAREFGFQRSEFRRDKLVGTVQLYDRHLFLRYKSPDLWLPNVEGPESDHLPRLLAAAMKARKDDMKKKTRLAICGAADSTDTSEGDVLIFPEMIGYRGLTDGDIDNFVDLVLVKETEWLSGVVETLTGSYIFVCAHGSRDRRCGVCGPPLIEKFKEEISLRGFDGQVFVSPCSHIGGHKYAGNVIIFSRSKTGHVSGNWYGYVSPDDVPMLLEQQIGKGEIIDHLWRGQMGLSVEEQRKAQSIRCQPNTPIGEDGASGCCQGNGNLSCCQNAIDKPHSNHKENNSISSSSSSKITDKKKNFTTWLKPPKPGTYATLAFAVAIASVSCAFFYYRNRR